MAGFYYITDYVVAYLHPEIDTLYFSLFGIFRSEFLIQDLISRPILNENEISVCQNLSLGVFNQK